MFTGAFFTSKKSFHMGDPNLSENENEPASAGSLTGLDWSGFASDDTATAAPRTLVERKNTFLTAPNQEPSAGNRHVFEASVDDAHLVTVHFRHCKAKNMPFSTMACGEETDPSRTRDTVSDVTSANTNDCSHPVVDATTLNDDKYHAGGKTQEQAQLPKHGYKTPPFL